MKTTLLFFTLVLTATLQAQTSFSKKYSGKWHETVTGTVYDGDNNLYVTGVYSPNATMSDGQSATIAGFFVAKYNANGSLAWMKKGRGTIAWSTYSNMDKINALDFHNGNLYVGGFFKDSLYYDDFKTKALKSAYPHKEICLLKINANTGALTTHKIFAGDSDGFGEVNSLKCDSQGNVHITGTFTNSMNFGTGFDITCWSGLYGEVYVAKFNANLETQWVYKPKSSDSKTVGVNVVIDKNGDAIFTGIFSKGIEFDPAHKFLANGTSTNPGDRQNAFVAKLNKADGTLNWVKIIEGEIAYNLTHLNAFITTDNTGAIYTGVNYSKFIKIGADSLATTLGTQIALMKFSASGSKEWLKTYGASGGDQVTAITVNKVGNILIGANLFGNVAIDNITADYSLTGSRSLVIGQFTPAGAVVDIKTVNDQVSNNAGITAIAAGKTDNRYVFAGYYSGTLNLGGGVTLTNSSEAVSYQDAFIYQPGALVGLEENNTLSITAYPNPTSGLLQLKGISEVVTISVYNAVGAVVQTIRSENITENIDLSEFEAGMYLVKVSGENREIVLRIVKN